MCLEWKTHEAEKKRSRGISQSKSSLKKKTIKLTNMEAALRQPVLQGTISEEKWESLHTIEELDSALKNVIHKHFQG